MWRRMSVGCLGILPPERTGERVELMTDMYLYVSDVATKIDGAKRFSFEGIWSGPAEVRSLSGNEAPAAGREVRKKPIPQSCFGRSIALCNNSNVSVCWTT